MLAKFFAQSGVLAVKTQSEFKKICLHTLAGSLNTEKFSPEQHAELAKKLTDGSTAFESYFILRDLQMSEEDISVWLQALGKKLKANRSTEEAEHYAKCGKSLHSVIKPDKTIKETIVLLSADYVKTLLQRGTGIILNDKFNFNPHDVRAAFAAAEDNRKIAYNPTVRGYFILQHEYFNYLGEYPRHITHREMRRLFLQNYFSALQSFGELLDKNDCYYVALKTF